MSDENMYDADFTYEGEIIGKARLVGDGVVEAQLTSEGFKKLFPNVDPVEGLSIYEPVKEDVMGPYLPEDISLLEAYYRNRPKGTFDA